MAPSIDSATAALAGATVNAEPHLRPAERLGCRRVPDHLADVHPHLHGAERCQRAAALKGFMNYIYGDGQTLAPTVDFAPLPSDILSKAKAQVGQIGS